MKISKIAQLTALTSAVAFSSVASAALNYSQDFEAMDPNNSAALADDGWLVGANVFDSTGTNFIYNYFAFPAPNVPGGGPAFSGVATGEGGAPQGNNQFNTYNDYNNADHTNGSGNRIEAVIFRDVGILDASDVGKTYDLLADAKLGNLGGATTADMFIKVVKTSDLSFADLGTNATDTTAVGPGWQGISTSILITAGMVGETLQIGFRNTASNGDSSGVFYDNVNVSAVPVPAAVWFMGSALLGLAGVKRSRK